MKRLLGWYLIAIALFVGLVGGYGFCLSRMASSDPMGSSVMADTARTCAIVSGTMACLGIYILKSRMAIRLFVQSVYRGGPTR
jgi:hypothetical protein